MAAPEKMAVTLAVRDGNLGLSHEIMYRVGNKEDNKLVPEFLLKAADLPLLPLDWVGARNTEAQKFLGGAAKYLMLLLMGENGARRSHAGKVAPEKVLPRVHAVYRMV